MELRHRYLQDLVDYRKKRREELVGDVLDVVLADPVVAETPRESVAVVPAPAQAPVPTPRDVDAATAAGLAPPEKQPLKSYRINVYGHCPECQAPIFEAQAKFCSQCAMPLSEP